MKTMSKTRTFLMAILLLTGISTKSDAAGASAPDSPSTNASTSPFIVQHDGKLWRDGKPYYFVGTNFWYGAILGSEGQGGDRKRLCRELDLMKHAGIDNLRILVGSDGERGVKTKVEPTLQVAPGVYNDTILAGLDYLLMEMGKRKMVAVLYLNNSWEWSGGYGFYLEHAGKGKAPRPNEAGYQAYMQFVEQYATCEEAHQLFYNYVRFILTRTNRYTGKRYAEDPAIMSWQIGNEPRAFSRKALPAFEKWLREASALIRKLDPNHLISIGSEGAWGCEGDYDVWKRICQDPNIDYCNIHLWPYNWGWAKQDSLTETLPRACKNAGEYIDRHLDICRVIGKPLVMEEFGYPRDGFRYTPGSPTTARDNFYHYVFQKIVQDRKNGGPFAGCNFWGWGGLAEPRHEQWQVGDPYTGDPAQEAQGLNSVFAKDKSTLKVIKQENKRLKK
jgi:mannan endo-1,4-beta-mannosidase